MTIEKKKRVPWDCTVTYEGDGQDFTGYYPLWAEDGVEVLKILDYWMARSYPIKSIEIRRRDAKTDATQRP